MNREQWSVSDVGERERVEEEEEEEEEEEVTSYKKKQRTRGARSVVSFISMSVNMKLGRNLEKVGFWPRNSGVMRNDASLI